MHLHNNKNKNSPKKLTHHKNSNKIQQKMKQQQQQKTQQQQPKQQQQQPKKQQQQPKKQLQTTTKVQLQQQISTAQYKTQQQQPKKTTTARSTMEATNLNSSNIKHNCIQLQKSIFQSELI